MSTFGDNFYNKPGQNQGNLTYHEGISLNEETSYVMGNVVKEGDDESRNTSWPPRRHGN